jgi:amino acid transporter
MTLPPLLTLGYWFTPTPPPFLHLVDTALLVTFSVFILVGIAAQVLRSRMGMDKLMRRAVGRTGGALISTGLVGLILYSFSYERVPFLSMRILFLAWAVWFVWTAVRLYRHVMTEIPTVRAEQAARNQFNKWLPKKK